MFFAIAIHLALKKLEVKFPENVSGGYLDDIATVFPRLSDPCSPFVQSLAAEGKKVGLTLQMKKTDIYSPHCDASDFVSSDDLAALKKIAALDKGVLPKLIPAADGIKLLGCPIGSDLFIANMVASIVEKIGVKLQNLEKIRHLPQESMLLLRHCFNTIPMHLARTVDPSLLLDGARRHDSLVNAQLAALFPGVSSTPLGTVWDFPRRVKQLRLPKKSGGFGITSLELIRHPAYLGSVTGSWSHMCSSLQETRCMDYWVPRLVKSLGYIASHSVQAQCGSRFCPREALVSSGKSRTLGLAKLVGVALADSVAPLFNRIMDNPHSAVTNLVQSDTTGVQKRLSSFLHRSLYDKTLVEFFPPTINERPATAASFISSSSSSSVAFAHAVPTHGDLIINPKEYHTGVAFVLQLQIPGRGAVGESCPHNRTHHIDSDGRHLVTCGSSRSIPHDELRDAFCDLAVASGTTTKKEPTNLLTVQDVTSQCRPDLLLVGVGAGGKDCIVDFTTTDVTSQSNLGNAVRSYCRRGASARAAESAKVQLYSGKFDRDRYVFSPAAVELSGSWGPGLEALFTKLCRCAVVNKSLSGFQASLFVSYWRKVIDVRFSRSLFRGAYHMLDQIVAPDAPLDLSRELAVM